MELPSTLLCYLNEIIGVKIGLKKVARQRIEIKYLKDYLKFIKILELRYAFWPKRMYFYISKEKNEALEAMKLEVIISKMNLTSENFELFSKYVYKLGKLFGYPECCINFYISCWKKHILNPLHFLEKEPNYILYSYLNTKNKKKLNFLLNNLSVYRVISHFPCSYECKESLKFAINLFKALPQKQRKICKKILRRDFLVWHEEKVIGFQSRFKCNKISYNSENVDILGISKNIIDALRRGNRLELDRNQIRIFRDNRLILKFEEDFRPFILSFY